MYKFFTYCILCIASIFSTTNESDADIECIYYLEDINVSKDGTSETTAQSHLTCLKTTGESLKDHVIFFNPETETCDVIEAYTIFKEKKYKADIEKKPVASGGQGFDQIYQIRIIFSHFEVGATRCLKIKKRVHKPLLASHYYDTFLPSSDRILWKHYHIQLKSAIKLNFLVMDHKGYFDIQKNDWQFSIKLTKNFYPKLLAAHNCHYIDPKRVPVLRVSTLTSFNQLANFFAPKYDEALNQDLKKIPLLSDIYDTASAIKNPINQLNFITSTIFKHIHYFGDWRSQKGQFFPRPFHIINDKRLADCKEFSVMTGAILKKLGYTVHVSLVNRGDHFYETEDVLPSPELFNHAILKVQDKNGKTYWIDPTNQVSMSDITFPDISARHALVLGDTSPYQWIEENKPDDGISDTIKTVELSHDREQCSIEFLRKGIDAHCCHSLKLNIPPQDFKKNVERSFLNGYAIKSISLPSDEGRIAIPFKGYLSGERQIDTLTNGGKAYHLPMVLFKEFLYLFPEGCNDRMVYIGIPSKSTITVIIKNENADQLDHLNCHIKNSFGSFSRTCYQKGHDVHIIIAKETYKRFVTPEDMQTQEFKDFKKWIFDHYKNKIILFLKDPESYLDRIMSFFK
jgi:hypothetical protein